ncbi:MAG: ABC transporter permease [Candidatus Woesearchaeota archaeon]
MKLIRCLKKNMKILARSKGSALVVLLAPLIIVFIIGLGFMEDVDQKLNIGVHTKESSTLADRYIQSFNTTEHNIIIYDSEKLCASSIEEGITVLCAVFSEDFEIRDGAKNELIFYVDESRMNLVDRLISSFSTSLGTESSEISEELANQLINIVEVANKKAEESLANIITTRAQIQTATNNIDTAKKETNAMDTTKETISTSNIQTKLNTVETEFDDIKSKAQTVVNEALEIEFNETQTELENAIDTLNTTIYNSKGTERIDELQTALATLSVSITKITDRIDKADKSKQEITNDLNQLQTSINTISQNTDELKTKQEEILAEIQSFELRSARSITNPVTTNVQSVSSTNTRLTYSFSYLLTLAILFIGLMLASTLVYMEKDSKAFFRNFTTPTTQKYFMYINYLTALIIIALQTIIILAIAHYTLSVPILTNPIVTIMILLLGITLFISMGLLIGTVSSTSEAVTMSNIVIGSVFLFLSNLILPLETLSPIVAKIASFNPYVIVSESLRRAMLFDAGFEQVYPDIIMLSAYIAIIMTLMIIINQLGFKHYIASRRHRKNLLVTEPENLILEMDEEVKVIKNMPELLAVLKKMTDEQYQDLIKRENPIRLWLKNNLKKNMLAYRLKNKKLSKVIELLEKYQHKKDKKIRKTKK